MLRVFPRKISIFCATLTKFGYVFNILINPWPICKRTSTMKFFYYQLPQFGRDYLSRKLDGQMRFGSAVLEPYILLASGTGRLR